MTVLDRVPVERINARAAQIAFLPLLLSLLGAPLVVLGWLTYYVLAGAGVAVKWVAAAFLVGYDMARERQRAG